MAKQTSRDTIEAIKVSGSTKHALKVHAAMARTTMRGFADVAIMRAIAAQEQENLRARGGSR